MLVHAAVCAITIVGLIEVVSSWDVSHSIFDDCVRRWSFVRIKLKRPTHQPTADPQAIWPRKSNSRAQPFRWGTLSRVSKSHLHPLNLCSTHVVENIHPLTIDLPPPPILSPPIKQPKKTRPDQCTTVAGRRWRSFTGWRHHLWVFGRCSGYCYHFCSYFCLHPHCTRGAFCRNCDDVGSMHHAHGADRLHYPWGCCTIRDHTITVWRCSFPRSRVLAVLAYRSTVLDFLAQRRLYDSIVDLGENYHPFCSNQLNARTHRDVVESPWQKERGGQTQTHKPTLPRAQCDINITVYEYTSY